MNSINFLTPEKEALIPEYQEKWQGYITSTEPIDKQKAQEAVNAVYKLMGKKAPQVVFCNSPYEVLQLKHRPDKSSNRGFPANAAELNERFRSQSSSLFLFYLRLIIRAIFTTVASALWNRLKPKNPIYELQLQLNKSATKSLSKKIDEAIPSQIDPEDIVEQTFNNAVEMAENQPQAEEIRESFSQFNRQSPEAKQASFSTTASNTEEQLNWLPLQSKFMRWWFKRFSLGTFTNKITIRANSVMVDPTIQRDLLQKMPQTLQKYAPVFTTQAGVMSNIWLDYANSVLNFSLNAKKLTALQNLSQECGWIFVFARTCYICDRPTAISLDENNRLHGVGEPAIAYQDGYSIYANHGVVLPEKYGAVHPRQWQAQWLLEEENAELRRVLIQEIGYDRLCQELAATELDTWREYTLLRIDNQIDVEPIHLLKMTCPSTGYIHSTRVPPTMRSAQEAIRWVNWDINPEEFAIET